MQSHQVMYDLEWDEDEEATLPGSTLRAGRILVADDDEALRTMLVSRLLDDGHSVAEADTGARVLSRIEERRPSAEPPFDLLLIDQRMPGLVGMDVIRAMRAGGVHLHVILMTAFPEPNLLAEAQKLSVQVIAKPFSLLKLSTLAARSIHAGQHTSQ